MESWNVSGQEPSSLVPFSSNYGHPLLTTVFPLISILVTLKENLLAVYKRPLASVNPEAKNQIAAKAYSRDFPLFYILAAFPTNWFL